MLHKVYFSTEHGVALEEIDETSFHYAAKRWAEKHSDELVEKKPVKIIIEYDGVTCLVDVQKMPDFWITTDLSAFPKHGGTNGKNI